MNKPAGHKQQHGMTLLELLVAVALLSVISVMAFAGLLTLSEAKQQMEDSVAQMNRETAALGLFQQDIKMATGQVYLFNPSKAADFRGDAQSLYLTRFNPFLAVPRRGMINPVNNRPAPVISVRWFMRDGQWYRATRSALSTPHAPWQEQAMLPLQQIYCRYRSVSGRVLDRWPPDDDSTNALPNAVLCQITTVSQRQSDLTITPWQQIW